MIKYRFFIDFSKEEKWLNKMSKSGYEFVSKNKLGGYIFREAEPNDTTIRMDYRLFKKEIDFQDYCTLFEDSGWKHIAGKKSSGNQYFAKIKENAANDIFSDNASKAGRYKRISEMWLTTSIIFIPMMVALLCTGAIDVNALLNPKLLYFTPMLWEKTGLEFWYAFLFETPFALVRGLLCIFFPIAIFLSLYFALRAYFFHKQSFSN
ncbi:DUF2812 domain-containing protein [Candidatus Contubernalis alkaliaceticus]|uniref:DUF2812 domain-containing protein n=1 Tax=Candidatus Contubernalis alkaliaceticus TaxID=338645 RepID=UPI001F4BEDDC|nr:DUF2812 domain-containing protein [Candidatus Contubernalis alkalaceticus]UNC91990.1 DUF2812 domain-containing protein [Candidatus Contubernalis alkalaceticus]